MSTIIRVCVEYKGWPTVYYEPALTAELRAALARLQKYGWKIRVRRINAEKELARLKAQAEELNQAGATLRGVSGAWLACAVHATCLERLIMDAENAARGQGSLLAPV